jgi:hypothetical protein
MTRYAFDEDGYPVSIVESDRNAVQPASDERYGSGSPAVTAGDGTVTDWYSCRTCGADLRRRRWGTRYCSSPCRQKAYRARSAA